jgi:uncharacterized membrane protein YkgB
MNITNTLRTAATLATTTALAVALTTVSVTTPTANAQRAIPFPDGGGSVSAQDVDFAVELAHRKARWAQYYLAALELNRPSPR